MKPAETVIGRVATTGVDGTGELGVVRRGTATTTIPGSPDTDGGYVTVVGAVRPSVLIVVVTYVVGAGKVPGAVAGGTTTKIVPVPPDVCGG
jgi:hypothetical protein